MRTVPETSHLFCTFSPLGNPRVAHGSEKISVGETHTARSEREVRFQQHWLTDNRGGGGLPCCPVSSSWRGPATWGTVPSGRWSKGRCGSWCRGSWRASAWSWAPPGDSSRTGCRCSPRWACNCGGGRPQREREKLSGFTSAGYQRKYLPSYSCAAGNEYKKGNMDLSPGKWPETVMFSVTVRTDSLPRSQLRSRAAQGCMKFVLGLRRESGWNKS